MTNFFPLISTRIGGFGFTYGYESQMGDPGPSWPSCLVSYLFIEGKVKRVHNFIIITQYSIYLKVKLWITFNEPQVFITAQYGSGSFPPGVHRVPGVDEYIATHNVIKAHAKTYRSYDKSQNGELFVIFLTLVCLFLLLI